MVRLCTCRGRTTSVAAAVGLKDADTGIGAKSIICGAAAPSGKPRPRVAAAILASACSDFAYHVASMTRLARRLMLVLALLIAVLTILSAVGVTLFRGTPDWYVVAASHSGTSAQHEADARNAENKLIETHNWAELLHA